MMEVPVDKPAMRVLSRPQLVIQPKGNQCLVSEMTLTRQLPRLEPSPVRRVSGFRGSE